MQQFETTEPKPLTIDKVFADGSSTVSFCGRNDAIVKMALEILPHGPERVLVLGCGPYELWTTAGQKRVIEANATVIGIDRSPQITSINQTIKTGGQLELANIQKVVGNPVFGQEKKPKTSKQLLAGAEIQGVEIDEEKISVDAANRDSVQIAPPSDANDFVAQQDLVTFSLIFSGNLENNLLFQKGYTRERGIGYHKNIARLLRQQGIYVYTTNDLFFNETSPQNPRSVIGILGEAGLDILYKATQYTHTLLRNGQLVVTENCGLITAKQGEYNALPEFENRIAFVREQLGKFGVTYSFIENQGTLEELQNAIAQGQTNLALVKRAPDKYHWFNTQGSYAEVFPRFAQTGDGFYPELF